MYSIQAPKNHSACVGGWNTMASLASQLSSRRLARAEARQSHNELRLTVLNLLEKDERFAPRLRAFVEDFQRTVAAEELQPTEEAPAEEVEALIEEANDGLRADQQRLIALAEATGVAVAAMRPWEPDTSEGAWNQHDGASLESELRVDAEVGGSAVRLIDARYLIELERRGGIFVRRQDLPEAAFLSLEALKLLPMGGGHGDCLRIISVSHPWQHPDHPDPKGLNLKLLAHTLKAFVEHRGGTYAIFLDFLSVPQKGPTGEARSELDAALFTRALRNMMVWYSHPRILTLKLTALPPDYPNGFTFPLGITPNTASYFERGWCFCESSVTNLTKDFDYVLDLGKLSDASYAQKLEAIIRECAAGRSPPLTPVDFCEILSAKSFTSKKADEETVVRLYESTFTSRFAKAKTLHYSSLAWGDAEMVTFSKVVASGALASCQELYLDGNRISDDGLKALAQACASGALDQLQVCWRPSAS